MPFRNFKTRLLATVRYLCPLLREHINREDQAIFPLAVSMIHDDKVWDRLRRVCNEIDYCGIHL
jgi:hemerythrin-like domain-containing protein